jgi:hypothetical protein
MAGIVALTLPNGPHPLPTAHLDAVPTAGPRPGSPAAAGTRSPSGPGPGAGAVAVTGMDKAVLSARSELSSVRQRFVCGKLPEFGHLIVRHELAVPTGTEAPWALVRSWRTPAALFGRSLNDAVHPKLAHIRMGRPVLVHVETIIDWAIVSASGHILEGAWTRDLG